MEVNPGNGPMLLRWAKGWAGLPRSRLGREACLCASAVGPLVSGVRVCVGERDSACGVLPVTEPGRGDRLCVPMMPTHPASSKNPVLGNQGGAQSVLRPTVPAAPGGVNPQPCLGPPQRLRRDKIPGGLLHAEVACPFLPHYRTRAGVVEGRSGPGSQ